MGEYRNGRWVDTFGDVQFGMADEAPGELPFNYGESKIYSQVELDAHVAEVIASRRCDNCQHFANGDECLVETDEKGNGPIRSIMPHMCCSDFEEKSDE